MVAQNIRDFVDRVVASVGDQLESITFYPHPFTNGGLVVVPKPDVEFIPDLISQVYRLDPAPVMIYFLRGIELFELSLPGVFGWTIPLEEKPHLAFWLKKNGTVLFGRDIRPDIRLPADTSPYLEIHIQRIKHCIRNWVLEQLGRQNYQGIVREMERQTRYVMATALLAKAREWEYAKEDIPGRFKEVFKDQTAEQVWADLTCLTQQVEERQEQASRESAFEAVWFFEQFIKQMGAYA